MGDVTTSYKVRIFFEVEKQKAVADFFASTRKGAEDANRHVEGLSDTLKGVAKLAAGAFGLHEAKRAFIDFNSDMEQAKLTMAGLVSSMRGGTLQDSLKDANRLVDQLQLRSKSTVLTTEELVHMAQSITEPVMQAGGNMKTLEDFTVGAAVAAKALGANADYASIEITEALQGNWTKRARFMNMLMGPSGMDQHTFNHLSAGQRFSAVSSALNAPWIKNLAAAQHDSFAGVTSTLKDNIQIALGKVGLPLFKAITKEIGSWNEWFDKHPKEIEDVARQVTALLMGGFGVVKDVMQFVWENRELLKLLAEAVLVSKGVGFAGSLLNGGFGKLGNLVDRLGGVAGAAEKLAEEETTAGERVASAGGKFVSGLQAFTGGFAVGMGLVKAYYNQKDKEDQARMEYSTVVGFSNVFAGEYGGLFGGGRFQKGATPFRPAAQLQMQTELAGTMALYKREGMLDEFGQIRRDKLMEAAEGDLSGQGFMVNAPGGPGNVDFVKSLAYRRSLGSLSGLRSKADSGGLQDAMAFNFAKEFDERFSKELDLLDKMQVVLNADADRRLQDWDAMMARLGLTIADALDPVAVGSKLWKGMVDAAKAKNAAHEHGDKTATPKKSDVHVHVNKMEVYSDDADRVVLGVMTLAEDALRNPSTAAGVYRDR